MARTATLAVADPAERRNGTGRRMPVRTQEIAFDWEGETWHATMRTNAPSGQVDALLGRDPDSYRKALTAIVQAWDFVDDDGDPIPVPSVLIPVPVEPTRPPAEGSVDADGKPIPVPVKPVPVMRESGIGRVSYPQLRALVGAYLDALAAPKD